MTHSFPTRRSSDLKKISPLNTRRSWFGPVRSPRAHQETRVCGGAAGYCPRVRCVYSTTPFILIAGRNRQHRYREPARVWKERVGVSSRIANYFLFSSSRISVSRSTSVGPAGASGPLRMTRFTIFTSRKLIGEDQEISWEESRVGTERVRTCNFRVSPYH